MATWLRKIDIKQFLKEDSSPEAACDTAAKLAEYIRANVPDYPPHYVAEFDAVKDEPRKWQLTALNLALSHFYDYADDQRIWCGL